MTFSLLLRTLIRAKSIKNGCKNKSPEKRLGLRKSERMTRKINPRLTSPIKSPGKNLQLAKVSRCFNNRSICCLKTTQHNRQVYREGKRALCIRLKGSCGVELSGWKREVWEKSVRNFLILAADPSWRCGTWKFQPGSFRVRWAGSLQTRLEWF